MQYEYTETTDEDKEDLEEKFRYINSLPRQQIRGLEFPADGRGYYVSWPGDLYYKYRLRNPGKGSKYLSPKGHRPSLFWARKRGYPTLFIVEGEISALSVAFALPEVDVCSPGSASMFNSNNLSKYLSLFTLYCTVVVVLDDDAAGLKGLIEAKAAFRYKIPFVTYTQIKPDANEILVESGKEVLRERLQRFYSRP